MSRLLGLAIATALIMTLSPGSAPASASDAARAAARTAQEQHGGRVLKVERVRDSYRVKLLQDSGKVKIVRIPAHDGASKAPRKRAPRSKR